MKEAEETDEHLLYPIGPIGLIAAAQPWAAEASVSVNSPDSQTARQTAG